MRKDPFVELFKDRAYFHTGRESEFHDGMAAIGLYNIKAATAINAFCMTVLYGGNVEWETARFQTIVSQFEEVDTSRNNAMNMAFRKLEKYFRGNGCDDDFGQQTCRTSEYHVRLGLARIGEAEVTIWPRAKCRG